MTEFPTYEEMGKKVAEKALDEFLYDGKSIREWMQIIASEDAISRQEVLEQINCWIDSGDYRYTNATDYLRRRINYLSPVTPRQKIGHWVYDEVCSNWYDIIYKCSCCERRISFTRAYETEDEEDDVYRNYPYCHCGAKMVKPQESEDKE